jgi:hypothetical protein
MLLSKNLDRWIQIKIKKLELQLNLKIGLPVLANHLNFVGLPVLACDVDVPFNLISINFLSFACLITKK